jgi:hypothetical protein
MCRLSPPRTIPPGVYTHVRARVSPSGDLGDFSSPDPLTPDLASGRVIGVRPATPAGQAPEGLQGPRRRLRVLVGCQPPGEDRQAGRSPHRPLTDQTEQGRIRPATPHHRRPEGKSGPELDATAFEALNIDPKTRTPGEEARAVQACLGSDTHPWQMQRKRLPATGESWQRSSLSP